MHEKAFYSNPGQRCQGGRFHMRVTLYIVEYVLHARSLVHGGGYINVLKIILKLYLQGMVSQ